MFAGNIHTPTVDKDVINCLDALLVSPRFYPRVDTAMMDGDLGALAVRFEQRANSIVRHIMNSISETQRCQPHVFFCESQQYSAFVLRDKYDYIVLNFGVVLRLTHFCERMMSNRGLWPDVPDDSARNALAVVFMSECFDLIVRHELAHVVLGHIDPEGSAARVDPIAAQALELAADGHAAIWGLERLMRVPGMIGRLPAGIDGGYREFHRTRDGAMLNYLLAIYFVFRIMDEAPWDSDKLAHRLHPPASMRFHAICIHLNEHFERVGNEEDLAQFLRARQKAWGMGESVFARALDREPDVTLEGRTMSEECEKLYERMSEHARILPHHFFGLA